MAHSACVEIGVMNPPYPTNERGQPVRGFKITTIAIFTAPISSKFRPFPFYFDRVTVATDILPQRSYSKNNCQ